MKIGITTCGCDDGRSGIGKYLIRLLEQFDNLASDDDQIDLIGTEESIDAILPSGTKIRPIRKSIKYGPVGSILWHQIALPRLARSNGYDVLFLPAANRRLPTWSPCPTVGTIHDFSWRHMKDKYDRARIFYLAHVLPRQMARLDWALTVSECSKADILANTRLTDDRVVVTPLAADSFENKPEDRGTVQASLRQKWNIDKPYWFYISRLEHPGKNHIRLIRAFEMLKEKYEFPHMLVLAGGDFLRAKEVHQAIDASPYRNQIIRTGFADDADVRQLYLGAELFIFPSLYEGFGLPLLEAMQLGVPVASANRSSLPEVGADAPIYFNPYDTDEMASAIRTMTLDEKLRNEHIQKGLARAQEFSWRKTAEETWKVLARAAGKEIKAESKQSSSVEDNCSSSKEKQENYACLAATSNSDSS
jgi:glycosyltransferase involved in cell wall biosynthesis